ncbi:glycoside hydrolase superfamily [Coniella lustricola]|uniref:Glycoside hydrolase superfamily n=1 Tax=Coniella lustricola TaxID=2025994 RepID=A0A2T2ZV18_9PEZI|nr:glycoside hydrolase superfamily [Coniella lustricola]
MGRHTTTLLALTALAGLSAADETWTISASTDWGTWEGWGVSLAWWAKAFGTRSDLADLFFSLDTTTYNSASVPGLGLNMARYNAGACSNNTYAGAAMAVSPAMMASRQMDGYWWDWASGDPASSSWHWTVDASQRAMLAAAVQRGANHLELFSNSPMWWMLYNRNPSGADDGGSDNLQTWNYDNHTHYLAEIALYAKQQWGVAFESVEPFNEPSAAWWAATSGTQEGCHFDVATQAAVVASQRSALDGVGLASVAVSASDENTYDEAVATWDGLGSAAVRALRRVNVHGYEDGSGSRDGLYALATAQGLRIWNSEYGDSDGSGASLVSNLILDLRWLHPVGWVYWQAVDVEGWGLVAGDNEAVTLGAVSQKYYALAQFTRHIREGMVILDGGADHVVAAYDAAQAKLVIVAVNWGAAQYLNFELSAFSTPGTSGQAIPRWSTVVGAGGGSQYVETAADTVQHGTVFWSYFETNEIQTFEVAHVKM